jgi:hypothetical protein
MPCKKALANFPKASATGPKELITDPKVEAMLVAKEDKALPKALHALEKKLPTLLQKPLNHPMFSSPVCIQI